MILYGCGCGVVGRPNHFITHHPHLLVEKTLPLLWIFGLILLDLGGGNSGTGLCVNDLLPFVNTLVRF